MMESASDEMMKEFVSIALTAGNAIMDVFNSGAFQATRKGDGSPVTVADTNADLIIRDGLGASFPSIPIVSEEHSESHLLETEEFFIVDPLDGTRGFVNGKSDFTVNIAYVKNRVPELGVVFAPALDRMFSTASDGRSVIERSRQSGTSKTAIHLPVPRDRKRLRLVASWSKKSASRLQDFQKRYAVTESRVRSSSIKFCLIAANEADLYPRFGNTMEWDTAAGHAILRATGGDVVQLDGFRTLEYGKPDFANLDFIAYGPGIKLEEV